VHLDPSYQSNGPLRVIDGSHTFGVLTDEQLSSTAHEGRENVCVVGKGGIIAMRPLLVHRSSKMLTEKPRRVLHIEYAESVLIEDGVRLAMA
jgi:ectoine hydroxylase-related dioxygenase (phytanoyl-CoA dioxygenase family)